MYLGSKCFSLIPSINALLILASHDLVLLCRGAWKAVTLQLANRYGESLLVLVLLNHIFLNSGYVSCRNASPMSHTLHCASTSAEMTIM